MADRETHVANYFETELTAELGPTDLVAEVLSTGGLQSPAILAIEPDNPNQREVILFDDAFTDTEFRTTSIANRYLEGSAQPGGLTHPAGSVVRSAPLAQHIQDLNDRIDADRLRITSLEEASTVGFRLLTVVYYTASDVFRKADYPGLRAVRVKVQAGGGGGGGCAAAGAGQGSSAGGGGGGGYVEALILAEDLTDSVTVTVGAGGAGGSAGNNNGSPGGDSSFGAYAVASGGRGGSGSGVTSGNSPSWPGAGGDAPTGDLRIRGDSGGCGHIVGGFGLPFGFGGGSFLGGSVHAGDNGLDGIAYGGGGSGARNATGAGVARAGGDGAPGIVLVELYF